MAENIEITTLFSSSKGNSVYLRSGNTRILIDAGRSLSALTSALERAGSSPSLLDAVFVTHEHTDHVSSLACLMRRHGVPVHMTERSCRAYMSKYSPGDKTTIITHDTRYEAQVGAFRLHSFFTPHDSEDSVGYIISTGTQTLGYATDMGCLTKEVCTELAVCDTVVVESNYDEEMLRGGSYPAFLKSRILSNRGHLSNDNCARLVAALAGKGVRGFILAHLSEQNNLPEKALRASCEALADAGHTNARIIVADRYCPTRF